MEEGYSLCCQLGMKYGLFGLDRVEVDEVAEVTVDLLLVVVVIGLGFVLLRSSNMGEAVLGRVSNLWAVNDLRRAHHQNYLNHYFLVDW